MSNQWDRHNGESRLTAGMLVTVIVVIGLVAYVFFPKFKNSVYSLLNPTYAATDYTNYSLPNTYDSSTLNSPTYSIQDSTPVYSPSSEIGSNEVSTGYWLLFLTNGKMNQLSVNAETTNFIQRLIESDRKGPAKNKLFLVDNGRIRQYMVSHEIYTVVSNISTIDSRALNGSKNSNPNNIGNSNTNALPSTNDPNKSSTNTSPNSSLN